MGNTEAGKTSTDLAVVEKQNNQIATRSIFDMGPEEKIAHAAKIATVLKKIIDDRKLSVKIQNGEYVKAEGWQTLGILLGIMPKERSVSRHADGSYEAYIDLVSSTTGVVVSGASSICSVKERKWGTAEEFARRSMAITRATGKAYRTGLSWIITLAGYEPTPAEEMPRYEEPKKDDKKTQTTSPAKTTGDIIEAETIDSDTYTGSSEQQQKIEAILKRNGIPEEHWLAIHQEMEGKPGKFFPHVMKKYKAQPHVQ